MENKPLEAAYPPTAVFRDGGIRVGHQTFDPGQHIPVCTRAHFPEEGGVLMYHEGEKFPTKGWPFNEAVYAVAGIKRAALNAMRFLLSSPMRYALPFVLLFPSLQRKLWRSAVHHFTDYTNVVFWYSGVLWKPQYYCDMAREVYRVGMEFAGNDADYQRLVDAICMTLEFEDAYRYFAQDGLMELDLEALRQNPAKEIVRVLRIMVSRSSAYTDVSEKFDRFARLVPVLFWVHGLKDSVLAFFEKVDMQKLYMDNNDAYRCLIWKGYNFGGIPFEHRVSLRTMIDADWQHQRATT